MYSVCSCDWEERADEAQKRIESSDAAAGLGNIQIVDEV
jgi:hypothetical protein